MAERTGWAPSDEMVEAAMQAEYEHDLAGMDHPTLAEFPRWTDWCDAEIHDALRDGMRAALAAVGPDIRAQAVRENEALTAEAAHETLAAALDVDKIARVLAEHSDYGSTSEGWTCVCGEPLAATSTTASDRFRAHQADVVALGERLNAEETPEDEQAAAAMRMALLESFIEALDYDTHKDAAAQVLLALRDRRDAQTAMRMIPGLFGARVYGRVLLFHQVAKTPLWGHAEALTSTGALREAGLTTADLGWPEDVLHDFYAADAAEWDLADRARFDAAVQAWRDAHPDGAL